MVFYLSNRLTNPFMVGIILTYYLSPMLEHKICGDAVMQTRNILLSIHVPFVYWKSEISMEKGQFLTFRKVCITITIFHEIR